MKNQKYKIILLILIMIVILIISILLGIKLVSLNSDKETIEVSNNGNNIIQENVIENNEIENEVNNTVNNEIEPEQEQDEEVEEENAQQKPAEDDNQEVDKEVIDKQESDKDKAKKIAEEHYGESTSVYFYYDGIDDNGKHKVFVKDVNSTHTIREYYINIDNETFEILQ